MIVAWNVRALNNAGKCRDIWVCLNKMKPTLVILLETRVKSNKVDTIRNKLGKKWMVVDNYTKHDNRKIWILWDDKNKGDLSGPLSPILT